MHSIPVIFFKQHIASKCRLSSLSGVQSDLQRVGAKNIMKKWIILALFAKATFVHAEIRIPTLEEAVSKSQLIVVGVLTNVQQTVTNQIATCSGTIVIHEVQKGLATNEVKLTWDYGLSGNEEEDQVDYTTRKNTTLIWLLYRKQDGTYGAWRAGSIYPLSKLDAIRKIVDAGPNHTSGGIRQPTDGLPKPSK